MEVPVQCILIIDTHATVFILQRALLFLFRGYVINKLVYLLSTLAISASLDNIGFRCDSWMCLDENRPTKSRQLLVGKIRDLSDVHGLTIQLSLIHT